MGIEIEAVDGFSNTLKRLQKLSQNNIFSILDKYGPMGVAALSAATPKESGETASSWYYTIDKGATNYEISWNNSHAAGGTNVALLIQYGHGTRFGGYVPPHPYIGRAIAPIFAKIQDEIRRAVSA